MLLAFPGLLLAVAIVAVLGPSLVNVLFALTIIGWVGYARLIRGQVLKVREYDFVQAARALGTRRCRATCSSQRCASSYLAKRRSSSRKAAVW